MARAYTNGLKSKDWGKDIARASKRKTSAKSRNIDQDLQRRSDTKQHSSALLSGGLYLLFAMLGVCGGLYIYEINALATKGYEIRELENKTSELTQESRQLKIRETELKSMYTIEKSMKDLNLVSSSNVSYVEMDRPVAMK